MRPGEKSSATSGAFVRCGEAVLRWRTKRGWTQAELGEQLGVTGAYIAQMETGVRDPSDNVCLLLQEVLQPPQEEWDSFLLHVRSSRIRRRQDRQQRRRQVAEQAQKQQDAPPLLPAARNMALHESDHPLAQEEDPLLEQAIARLRVVWNSSYRDAALAALEAWEARAQRTENMDRS